MKLPNNKPKSESTSKITCPTLTPEEIQEMKINNDTLDFFFESTYTNYDEYGFQSLMDSYYFFKEKLNKNQKKEFYSLIKKFSDHRKNNQVKKLKKLEERLGTDIYDINPEFKKVFRKLQEIKTLKQKPLKQKKFKLELFLEADSFTEISNKLEYLNWELQNKEIEGTSKLEILANGCTAIITKNDNFLDKETEK